MITHCSILAFSLLMFCSVCESETPVRRCPGGVPFPIKVQIDDCEEMPCSVTKGKSSQMNVQFVARKDETHQIETEVIVTVLGIKVPYELPPANGNVCKNLMYGAYCPLYAEEDVTFHLEFPIDRNFLETNIITVVKLRDSENDILACYIVDMKVNR